jgi:hypothetical protein
MLWEFSKFCGDGIIATGMEGMAARNSPNRQPTATPRTKAIDRGDRILRAGRAKATNGRKQRRNQQAIAPNQHNQQHFHRRYPINCFITLSESNIAYIA